MYDIAPLVTSTVVIFVGILAGILFNQRAFFKMLFRNKEAIEILERRSNP